MRANYRRGGEAPFTAFEPNGPQPECKGGCPDTSLLYYNASLFVPQGGQPVPAYITDSRAQGILKSPQDWDVSVVRFDLSANLLPPMVLPMPPGAPVVGTNVPSALTVTLRSLGVDYQATVNINVNSPQTYGFVYSISDLADRFNNAFRRAFELMPPVAGVTSQPYLVFDPVTQMMRLYYQAAYVTEGKVPTGAVNVEIWFNSAAYQYVESLPAYFAGYNSASGRDYRLQTDYIYTQTVPLAPPPPPPTEYVVASSMAIRVPAAGSRAGYPEIIQAITGDLLYLSQQGPSLASMNGVRSVFITTTMPINNENLPTVNATSQNANVSSNSMPILSDFLLGAQPGDNPVVDRISVAYLPSAEYRMVQLRGASDLALVDLRFWYSLFDGRIFELMLPPGGFASAKLLFRRRGTY